MIDHITQSKVPKYQCPPDKKAVRVYMDDRSGLNLYVTRNGSRTWDFQFKSPVTKKSAHYKVGNAGILSFQKAKEVVVDLRRLVLGGTDPRFQDKGPDLDCLYSEFMTEHYFPYVETRKKTASKDKQLYRDRLEEALGQKPIKKITRYEIERLFSDLQKKDLATSTINHPMKLLRHSLNLALDWQFIESNPAQRLKLIPEKNHRDRYLNNAELSKFVKVLKEDRNQPVARLVLWLIGTGCRLAEGMHARVQDVNFEDKIWVIRAADSKGGKSRTVYLSQFCLDIPKAGSNSEWLFPNPQTGRPYTTITRVFYRLRALAGLGSDVTPHTLRHSYCTYLAQAGLNGPTIMAAMGHSDFRTSSRYIHMHSGVYMQAANCVYERIDSALKKASGEN